MEHIKLHKILIILTSILAITLAILIIILEYSLFEEFIQDIVRYFSVFRGHRGFLNNILIGVWCSVMLTLIIEFVNYTDSKEKAINKFIHEATLIYNQYEILKVQLSHDREDIDKIRETYQAINQMNVSGLYDAINELTSLMGNKEIAKLAGRIFYRIEAFRQPVKRETEALWAWTDKDMVRGKTEELNKKFEYARPVNQRGEQWWNIANDIQEDLEQLNNLFWKSEWYKQKCKTIWHPFFLRGYMVDIIKWNKNIDKSCHNYRHDSNFSEYRKIPLMNYRVRISTPRQATQEEIEQWKKVCERNEK